MSERECERGRKRERERERESEIKSWIAISYIQRENRERDRNGKK